MTTTQDQLIARFASRDAAVGIISLGYVGLPLAFEFACAGYHVIGVVSAEKVAKLNGCESNIPDIPTEPLAPLVQSGCLRATTNIEDRTEVDAISICVLTPL